MESFQVESLQEEPPVYEFEVQQGGGLGGEEEEDAYPQTNGFLKHGEAAKPTTPLPPLDEMLNEESFVLREWKRKRAIELEEKARLSAEKHEAVLEEAKREQEAIYYRRQQNVAQSKTNNREKEKLFISSMENLNPKPGSNYWESVAAHINFDIPTGKKKVEAKKNEPTRVSTQLADQKPGKHTDLARMRQILLKLKHNPLPAHTVPLPVPEGKTDAKTNAKTDGKALGKSDVKAEGKVDVEAEGKVDGKLDAKAEGRGDGRGDGKADGVSDGKADGKSGGDEYLPKKEIDKFKVHRLLHAVKPAAR